jgi:hypothetical protein
MATAFAKGKICVPSAQPQSISTATARPLVEPCYVLIDPDSIVRYAGSGGQDLRDLSKSVEQWKPRGRQEKQRRPGEGLLQVAAERTGKTASPARRG